MVRRYADLTALAKGMADELPGLVQRTIDETFSSAHLVLSGGNTPQALFTELAARGREFLPWDDIHLWWGDERCVPPDHPDSNFGAAKRLLIDPLELDSSMWHRMKGEDPPEEAAKAYEEHIYNSFGDNPVFSVVLMGIGTDGHTASLFPNTQIDPERIVIASTAPSGQPRISMTPKLINAARHVRFLVSGDEKADVLTKILQGADLPAHQITNPDLAWLVDEPAARNL
jgi:6-phosphogluconolactonase